MKGNALNYWRRGPGDRYDGWRVRRIDPLFGVIPYIMRSRLDSQVFYEERINVDQLEDFVRRNRDAIPGLSIMHVLIAALVRVVSQYPRLNRFVVHNKIYARNSIDIALTIKRSMTEEGEEAVVKIPFMPGDAMQDVSQKINAELARSMPAGLKNETDAVSKVLGMLPAWLMRPVIWTLRMSDLYGCLPRFIHEASPWHASIFLTNMGSLGVESVYHHLYEFGTCSMFASMGRKSYSYIPTPEAKLHKHKSIMLRFVLDERICDGFYYASAMRHLAQILATPETLLAPPAEIVVDDGVAKKRRDV